MPEKTPRSVRWPNKVFTSEHVENVPCSVGQPQARFRGPQLTMLLSRCTEPPTRESTKKFLKKFMCITCGEKHDSRTSVKSHC